MYKIVIGNKKTGFVAETNDIPFHRNKSLKEVIRIWAVYDKTDLTDFMVNSYNEDINTFIKSYIKKVIDYNERQNKTKGNDNNEQQPNQCSKLKRICSTRTKTIQVK